MKSSFKIFLLTILSCCYFNTVFEFSDKEKKANFENEMHCYIHQANNDLTTFTTKTIPHFDFTFDSKHPFDLSVKGADLYINFFYYKQYPPPPDRLFLRHSSLLI